MCIGLGRYYTGITYLKIFWLCRGVSSVMGVVTININIGG